MTSCPRLGRLFGGAVRRFLIGRAIRRLLRGGARADLATRPGFENGGTVTEEQLEWFLSRGRSLSDGFRATPAAPPTAPTRSLPAGRQPIRAVRAETGLFAMFGQTTFDPFQIPDDAHSAKWEQKHLFSPYAKLPVRGWWGLQCSEPPLALACPDCEMKQPALPHGHRRCGYCGVVMTVHGTRLYWWREDEAPAIWPEGIARP
jgi:hypothetical protein